MPYLLPTINIINKKCLIYNILKKTMPYLLPAINIINKKCLIYNIYNLNLYKKIIKLSLLKKYKGKFLKEY